MKDKKILAICEKGGLAHNTFVKYLKKVHGDNLQIATTQSSPKIQNYDYCIFFEPSKDKLMNLLGYLNLLPKKTKKILFVQDPHLPIILNQYINIAEQFKFDGIITTQKDSVKTLKAALNVPTLYCTWALDQEVHIDYKTNRLYDLGLVGTLNPTLHPVRKYIVEHISKDYNFFPISEVKAENIQKVYSSCLIGLNYSITNDVNLRVFEIIGSGALLLIDTKSLKNGLSDILKEDEYLVYKDPAAMGKKGKDLKQLRGIITKALKDKKKIKDMANKSLSHVLQNHTYEHRAKDILKFLEELK